MKDQKGIRPRQRGRRNALGMIGGQVHLIFDNIPGALAQYRPGKVKGFGVNSWTALIGPARLPAGVVERISMFSRQALESPGLKQAFLDRGATAWWSSPTEVTAYRASEEKRLGGIIRKAKITLD